MKKLQQNTLNLTTQITIYSAKINRFIYIRTTCTKLPKTKINNEHHISILASQKVAIILYK